jgi:hypothetical protein
MGLRTSTASEWRIELAAELAPTYAARDGIELIVLGGSPTRGLADAFSDLDIVVYWDEIDVPWIERVPLADTAGERKALRQMGTGDVYLEQYYFGPLKVDFGHVTLGLWQEIVESVVERHETDASAQKTLAGFLAGIPLHGQPLYEQWTRRIGVYPPPLAVKMVREHLRFIVRGCLLNQGYRRGDLLFYVDGLCQMLKNLLGIWAGLNRVYLSTAEPRWLADELQRMEILPDDAWRRMQAVLTGRAEEAVEMLDRLIIDTLDLVDEHMPEVDVARARRFYLLEVEACAAKPSLIDASRASRLDRHP